MYSHRVFLFAQSGNSSVKEDRNVKFLFSVAISSCGYERSVLITTTMKYKILLSYIHMIFTLLCCWYCELFNTGFIDSEAVQSQAVKLIFFLCQVLFFKMGHSRPLFLFSSFLYLYFTIGR